MAYIANRPVRFDRNYRVGEVIPTEAIEPKMAKRLTEMGRILNVDIPAQSSAGEPQSGENVINGKTTQADDKASLKGQNDAAVKDTGTEEFICSVCGRSFKSQNALYAHLRSHKE